MARTVRNARIDSRTARRSLAAQREPYWVKIAKGRFLGYRRAATGGSWLARYRDSAHRQHHCAIGNADDHLDANGIDCFSYEQAQTKAGEWFDIMAHGGTGDSPRRGAYTVARCMEDYLAWVKLYRKSHRHLDTYIKAYILPRLGTVDTAKLTTPLIRKWHAEIAAEPPRLRAKKGKPIRYRSEDENAAEAQRKRRLRANRHLVTLKAALSRAWSEGRIARSDAWARVKPFPGTERPRSRFLNRAEAKRLMNACAPDLRSLVQLALLTGARFGELCAFDVRDFETERGTLLVRDSKSGKSRHIVLNSEGAEFCRQLVAGRPLSEPLLAKADGTRWARDHQFRPFKGAVIKANLDPRFTFHELRHTWASLTIMAGAPLMVVAQNLGHRDTRMVERHYGHLTDSYVAEVIRKTAPSYDMLPTTTVKALR